MKLTKREIGDRLKAVLEFQKSISNIMNGIKIPPKKVLGTNPEK